MKPWPIYINVQPGLELLATEELQELGLTVTSHEVGGLECVSHPRKIFQTIPYLRIPNRVLIRIGQIKAKHFSQFEKEFNKLDFSPYLTNQPIKAKVECHHCALYHKGALSERIEKYLTHERPIDQTQPTQTIYCRGQDNLFTISIDACGDHLHKRGILTKRGEAPLRETLAAAMVRAIQPQANIWDPFCGSGTLLLESHLYHQAMSVTKFRDFAFQSWPAYLKDVKASESIDFPSQNSHSYFGSDLDEGVVEIARENLSQLPNANFTLASKDFYNAHPKDFSDDPLHVICNPPYGERMPFKKLQSQFKEWQKDCPDLKISCLLPASKAFAKATTHFKIKNGGLNVVAQSFSS